MKVISESCECVKDFDFTSQVIRNVICGSQYWVFNFGDFKPDLTLLRKL